VSGLEALGRLVGSWEIDASHPMLEDAVQGRVEIEWLEGEKFLLHRSRNDHPEVPDSLSVIGEFEDVGLAMHYFDSRGVHRLYRMSLGDGVWKLWRDAPGFSQRFTGNLSDDGNTLDGQWELSTDDSTWDDDLKITYGRAGE
jgi:hypothetical protein